MRPAGLVASTANISPFHRKRNLAPRPRVTAKALDSPSFVLQGESQQKLDDSTFTSRNILSKTCLLKKMPELPTLNESPDKNLSNTSEQVSLLLSANPFKTQATAQGERKERSFSIKKSSIPERSASRLNRLASESSKDRERSASPVRIVRKSAESPSVKERGTQGLLSTPLLRTRDIRKKYPAKSFDFKSVCVTQEVSIKDGGQLSQTVCSIKVVESISSKPMLETKVLPGNSVKTEPSSEVEKKVPIRLTSDNKLLEPDFAEIKNLRNFVLPILSDYDTDPAIVFEARLLSESLRPHLPKRDIMLLEVDGVLCCTLKNYNSCLQESSVWLRRDAMDFLCELSPMLNIFILIDHKEKPEIVRKIIAKLVPFSVKGAIMFSKKMINDYRKVIQQLSVPDGTTVSVVRAVDTDIRTMGDFAQLVKEPNNQIARMTADLFPALMKTHIYFLRHNYFDIDPSRYHGEWSSEINLINIKGNEGLAQLSANLRKKSKKVHRVNEREAKHIEAAFHLERVLYNRANIINSLLGELRLVNKATGERRYPYPDTKEGIA